MRILLEVYMHYLKWRRRAPEAQDWTWQAGEQVDSGAPRYSWRLMMRPALHGVGQRERVRGRTAASLASLVAIPYVVLRLSAFGSPSLLHIDNESDWLADLLCLHIVSLFGVLILLRVVAL